MKKIYIQPALMVNTFVSKSFLLSGSPTPYAASHSLEPDYGTPGKQF